MQRASSISCCASTTVQPLPLHLEEERRLDDVDADRLVGDAGLDEQRLDLGDGVGHQPDRRRDGAAEAEEAGPVVLGRHPLGVLLVVLHRRADRIRDRAVCLIAALLAVKMALTVAPRRLRFTRTVVRHKALHRCPSLNLRAVDGKVVVRKQGVHVPMSEKLGQEFARHLGFKQPVRTLREHRRHPNLIIHAETDKPAIEQILMQLFHGLALRRMLSNACSKSARSSRSGGWRAALWSRTACQIRCGGQQEPR